MGKKRTAMKWHEVMGQKWLANTIGVSQQSVSKWKRGRIPAERVLSVERLTGISRHTLRPDLYPRG